MWLRQPGDGIQGSDGGGSGDTDWHHHKLLMAPQLLSSANGFKFVSSKEQTTVKGKNSLPSRLNLCWHQKSVHSTDMQQSYYKVQIDTHKGC